MICSWFDERIDALLAGRLPVDEQARAAAHAAECPRCGEVHALLAGARRPPVETPGDLAAAVLSRTSGPACEQARARVGDLLDGALGPVDRGLVESHLGHCADCAALAAAAARLGAELPALAALPPPRELVAAVLARTHVRTESRSRPAAHAPTAVYAGIDVRTDPAAPAAKAASARTHVRTESRSRPAAHAPTAVLARTQVRTASRRATAGRYSFPRPAGSRRWRDAVRQLFARPRIAWEAGYVAALLLWLVFGASWSPLRATAVEARVLLQQGVSVARSAGVESVASINRAVVAVSERTARATHGATKAAGRLAGPWRRRASAAAPDLGRHWQQLVQALEDRDLFGGVDALRALSRDAAAMLAELLSPSSSPPAAGAAPRPPERSRP